MSSAIRRLQKDFLEYQANRDEFTLISATPLEKNIFEWHVNICSPDGPYANIPLHFILNFPKNYPQSPPDVKLCTRIDHPNVFGNWGGDGAWICLDLLKEYTTNTKYEGWSSVYTVTSILLQLQSFLFSENVPQDYGGPESLEYDNYSVVSSLKRIKQFRCKCGHHHTRHVPALPKAYYQTCLRAEVSHTGSKIIAEYGAVVNQNSVFWQEFPAWKGAAWNCGPLLKQRGNKLQYEVKIDWGRNGHSREDIRIGWGYLTSTIPLNYQVIAESPADTDKKFWPRKLGVGDVLTTAIDLDEGLVWYAVNGKVVEGDGFSGYTRKIKSFSKTGNAEKADKFWSKKSKSAKEAHLVPIFRFRSSRLLMNFGVPERAVPQFMAGGFKILEPPAPKEGANQKAQIDEWKVAKDACADVFPVGVFQDIIEFLPMGDIINARSSCYTVRKVIEDAAIIPRREVHCFITKQSWKETVLGIGLTCEKSEAGNLEEVQPNMEFLSLEEWENGHRQSAWGEKLTDFLVLPVSRQHFNKELVVKYMEKFGASYRLGAGHSANEILNIFSKLMNMCVVTMMQETQGGKCNEKLLTGYTQFHHLLLSLNDVFPEVSKLAQKRVNAFISTPSSRHKKHGTPDLGKLLVMASLCPGLDWKKFNRVLFIECSTRRVLWYLKDCSALANTDHDDEEYCQKVFELTETSRCVVAFQVAFLKTLALPKEGESLNDVLGKYYVRYGQPRSADMESLFKQAKAIVECKTWKEHLEQIGLDGMVSGTDLARILKMSVERSLKANYHRSQKNHGNGHLKAARGNPAVQGLFRVVSKSATDLDNKATFYLPHTLHTQIKEVVSKVSGAKLSLPSNPRHAITIGARSTESLSNLKRALKQAFPYLSVRPMKNEYVEMEYEDYLSHEKHITKVALANNIACKLPKQFAFPVASMYGSVAGLKSFCNELEIILGRPLIFKTRDERRSKCKFCDMSFCGRDGACPPKGSTYSDADAKDNFVCRFCWPQMEKDLKRIARVEKEKREKKEKKEREARETKAKEENLARFLKEVREGKSLPAVFNLIRHAQVRTGKSLESDKVAVVLEGRYITVEEVVDNRARISTPVVGWVTITTAKGLLINPQLHMVGESCQAFPSLGCKTVSKLATTANAMPKRKPEKKKVVGKKVEPAKYVRKDSITSERSSNSSSDSGSSEVAAPAKKYVTIGPKSAKIAPKKASTGRKIIPGRTYTTCRAAVVRSELQRKSKYVTTLNEGAIVYVEKVYPKAHRAKITSPIRGWISTWTKNGRLLH